jgi:Ca2+-binding RTX toxin-like protein
MKNSSRLIRPLLIALLAVLALPAGAGAAVVTRSGTTIIFKADQGESNDLRVSQGVLLGQAVISFTDTGTGITPASGFCDLINGVGMCASSGVTAVRVNTRDKDDAGKVTTESSIGPLLTPTTLIGGRGADGRIGGNGRDRLKGNNGRDALRGRKGADVYKGGRGSDTLQALDGKADTAISCGDGRRDLLRADRRDPRPKSCELGNRKRRSKRR